MLTRKKKLNEVYGNKYKIHLHHEVVRDHGVFYPRALSNALIFELMLAPAMESSKIPFKAFIVGPTNSGKTKRNQLRGPFKGKFDYIVLKCLTFVHNKTYEGFVDKDPFSLSTARSTMLKAF